eukprot:CAMPEP_0178432832 /NCGR_PEP_ID=MMETSP0689_2-20121128/32595_1 /TAXON_ID=160604 /ORGANISM="Amphidinium massartii, Strain CS-259" /LENGTH=120 /DNA_ID=CAMNT_0020054845 /DNA_START=8 /DNA_END=367 /DNA_ORIENTATION=+
MARKRRLILLAAALVFARTVFPSHTAFAGTTAPAAPRGQISQSRVGMQAVEVYVANLDSKVSEEDLEAHMRQAGEVVEVRVRSGKQVGKRFAFIGYSTPEEATTAIEKLDDTLLGRREIS